MPLLMKRRFNYLRHVFIKKIKVVYSLDILKIIQVFLNGPKFIIFLSKVLQA